MDQDRDGVGSTANLDDDDDVVIDAGAAAYALIRSQDQEQVANQACRFEGWVKVRDAIAAVSRKAVVLTGSNSRMSPQYAEKFGELLDGSGFNEMDPWMRAALLRWADNATEIEAWWAKLTDKQRLRWNSPRYILQKWDEDRGKKSKRRPQSETIKELRDEVDRLKKQNEKLKREPAYTNGIDRDRLAKILGQFGSDQEGVVTNAARQAAQMVKKSGLTWFDVLGIPN